MCAVADQLWERDTLRRDDIARNLQRFNAKDATGRIRTGAADNLRVNLTKSVTETLMAKIGKNRPRPTVLTDGADHSLRVRAKKLQKFFDGVYSQAEVYAKSPPVFRDALLGGTGVFHFFADFGNRRVAMERVFPDEILVDPLEAINGTPQTMFRHKYVSKDVLARMFPKEAKEILALASLGQEKTRELFPSYSPETDALPRMVCVVEAWQLAGRTYGGELVPGKHVIASGECTLRVEPWEHDFFPFEFFHWTAPVRGFWGDSAVGEIRGIEKEVNKLLQSTQKAMHLTGNPWILNPNGAKTPTAKLTNEIGLVVGYEGQVPPTVVTHQAVHPSQLQQCWTLFGKAYELLGTNEQQASGTKPPGIESGRALEQLSEEHLVRFATVSLHWEDLLGRRFPRQLLRVAQELDDAIPGGFELRATRNKTALKIKWADAKISPDDFFVQCFPTSILPHLPSGRTQEVERWQANGWIDQTQAQNLLDFPDLESTASVSRVDQELLDQQLDLILDEGEEVLPDPRQDLMKALKWGSLRLEKAMLDGYPEENLQKLRNYLTAVEESLPPPPPAPAPPMDPMMGDPMAMAGVTGPVPPPI